jgi:hypothetical protein
MEIFDVLEDHCLRLWPHTCCCSCNIATVHNTPYFPVCYRCGGMILSPGPFSTYTLGVGYITRLLAIQPFIRQCDPPNLQFFHYESPSISVMATLMHLLPSTPSLSRFAVHAAGLESDLLLDVLSHMLELKLLTILEESCVTTTGPGLFSPVDISSSTLRCLKGQTCTVPPSRNRKTPEFQGSL